MDKVTEQILKDVQPEITAAQNEDPDRSVSEKTAKTPIFDVQLISLIAYMVRVGVLK